MSHDPIVLYDRLTQHVARCTDCRGSIYCPAAAELLNAWGASAVLADRQAAEYDCAEDIEFAREAQREAFE